MKAGTLDLLMQELHLPFFYQLGHELHDLAITHVNEVLFHEFLMACVTLIPTIDRTFSGIPSLTVSKPAGDVLKTQIEDMLENLRNHEYGEVDFAKPIDINNFKLQADASAIVRQAADFQTIINADLQVLAAYLVTQTGIYSVSDLVENAEAAFPTPYKEKLSEDAIKDIKQSGRCLAFGLGTACGFHILRATEQVMYEYYTKVCQRDTPPPRLPNWGEYIDFFRKSQDPHALRIAEMLQQIKSHDRNVIMHPDMFLDDDAAHTLFELAKGAIMAMAEQL